MSIATQITALQTDKTNIRNAILAKGGTCAVGNGFDDFATDIGTISGGGGSGWQRPSAWGEYPLEFQQEKAKEDSERTMEAIYLLYHHDTDKYGTIVNFAGFKATITGGYTVERGHMVGSTFTVDSTTSVASATFYTETFTDAMPEYITYRIKPITSGSTFTAFAFGHTDSDLNAVPQMQIESYGRTALSLIKSLFVARHIIHVDVIGYGTVTNMQQMFSSCNSLTSLDCSGWDTSAVTNMYQMFYGCDSLTSLDCSGWDTYAVTNMYQMFSSCNSLTSLDCSGWDTSAVTNMYQMFSSCSTLIDFNSPTFYISVSFSNSTHLSHDSLMSIINNLAIVSTTQTLTIGSTNLAKLTSAEIQVATDKGWTVA